MTALASDEYLLQVKCQKLAPDTEDVVWVAKMGDQDGGPSVASAHGERVAREDA